MARKPPRSRADRLLDSSAPAAWADELAAALATTWRTAAGGKAPRATIQRLGSTLATRIRAQLGDAEILRAHLRRAMPRLMRDELDDNRVRRELDALAERWIKPLVTRAERDMRATTELLAAEQHLAADARRLHQVALRAKHDGISGMDELIENEACALGTALMIYWLARPHYYRQYQARREVPRYEREGWDLIRRIEHKIAAAPDADGFLHLGIVFDPRTWERGYDWTRDLYAELPRKVPLPDHVFIRTTASGIEPLGAASRRQRISRTPAATTRRPRSPVGATGPGRDRRASNSR